MNAQKYNFFLKYFDFFGNQKIICNFVPLYIQTLLKGLAGFGSMAKKFKKEVLSIFPAIFP